MTELKNQIVTHNGEYHADDVLAVGVLAYIFPEYEICRTRDESIMKDAKFVIDVGGQYNSKKGRFDHHQVDAPLRSNGEGYSAFGLVWRHYGRKFIETMFPDSSQSKIDFIWTKFDNGFVREIDLNDTGKLALSSGHIAMLINQQNGMTQFEDIMVTARLLIMGVLRKLAIRYDAKGIVLQAYEDAKDKRIIELPHNLPWKSYVPEEVLFAIYPDNNGWKIGTASVPDQPMQPKFPLKPAWRGLRDEELSAVANIDGCIFVHNSGFVGANKTRKGALDMIYKTLNGWD